MLKTSLYEEHLQLNAKLVDFAGWQMPIQYKNLKEEVLAVRNDVGVFDVSHMGEFFVRGPQAIDFVDYIVTNDIKNAQMGKAIYSPMCREDGTVIDDLIVYKLAESKVMICVNAANIDKDFDWMNSKTENFDCTLSNHSSDYSLLAIQGPNSFNTLKKLDLNHDLKDISYYSIDIKENGETPIIFARTGYTGEDGFEIFAPHDYIKNVWKQLIEIGVTPCGLGARDVLRLEVCYPLYGHELSDELTPLDSGLKWTVKLNKEDFIGKQVLADANAKYKLIKLTLDRGIPREGYTLANSQGQEIGRITSGTQSVILQKGIALALVDKNLHSSGEEILVNIRNKQYPANIVTKAFVSGGHK